MERCCLLFLICKRLPVLADVDAHDLKLVVLYEYFRQHKKLQAKAAKKEQQALKEIEDSGAKVHPPPTVVPRDKPVPVKKLANFYKANKPKPAAHHVEADAAAAALEAKMIQSSSTMADQQIRRFLVKK